MTSWLIPLLAGTATGILSAFGIGGGSLLLIYLTAFAALDQHQAQGINLLYFLPAAAAALPSHQKNGLLEKQAILPAVLAGLAAAGPIPVHHPAQSPVLRQYFPVLLRLQYVPCIYIHLVLLFTSSQNTHYRHSLFSTIQDLLANCNYMT